MREIKFKGWHTVQKVMFSAETMAGDQLTLLPTGKFINVHSSSTRLSETYPPDIFIPLQYTGLKDKNGKESYHKDIVDFRHTRSTGYWVVEWNDSEAKHVLRSELYGEIPLQQIKEGFIIGNIYENPELLKEGGN